MKTMRAAWREKYCAPDAVAVHTREIREPHAHEMRVRVMATTVNRTDVAVLTGKPFIMRFFTGLMRPKLPIPGTDFAGTIDAVGNEVTEFKIGDRVWGFDDQGLSSQAEYVILSEKKNVLQLSAKTSFADAAAGIEGAHYACNFLNKVRLTAGQKVLVLGGTGAIGSALVQFCKHYGLEVTATAPTAHLEKVKALGADRVIDYQKEDFWTEKVRYNFVFDAVGKSTYGRCKRLLLPKGFYISSELGPGGQNIFFALLRFFPFGPRVIFPVPSNIRRSLSFVAGLVAEGKFKPLIDRHYPIEKVAAAYTYVASGQKIGNVILDLE